MSALSKCTFPVSLTWHKGQLLRTVLSLPQLTAVPSSLLQQGKSAPACSGVSCASASAQEVHQHLHKDCGRWAQSGQRAASFPAAHHLISLEVRLNFAANLSWKVMLKFLRGGGSKWVTCQQLPSRRWFRGTETERSRLTSPSQSLR